ncbi:SusC/RagA family TonB-linked outer membrane protein [Capnocytophaga sp. oral taxon 338]|uniref:SusC/RagA family TonB-linked outer membrane protein n=1 Tax=Capnocytophaga sp. oral taxon 338 TaxID=710239 RepID=UPI00058EC531|nr:SusC/RagA family TonB-linked outer membrane protein [Capnocytophaga sp. oral taxon 338]
MNLKKLFLLFCFVVTTMTFAQQKISGSVKDGAGKPVAGANVTVFGTTRMAKTNTDGVYSISAKEGEVLQFTLAGYKSVEVKVGLSSTIDAVLLPSVAQDGGEAGALGIKRDKNAVGYATQKTEADQGLSGNVAGVQTSTTSSMGGNTNVTIRGVGSITGSNQPLIVIDGVPMATVGDSDSKFGDAAGDINPEDIESVTVLSGGAATALYGSRGGNGVIIYTTKSGKAGKTAIDVKSSVSFERNYIAPKLQNEYGGGRSPSFRTYTVNGRDYNVPAYESDESWGPKYDNQPYLPWYAFDKEYLPQHYLKEVPWRAPKNDVDKLFRTGLNVANSVSVSRAVGGTNLRFSLGNNEVTGVVPNTKLQKTNVSFSFNSTLTKKLKSEGGFNYIITSRDNPENSYTMKNPISKVLYAWSQRQLDVKNLENYYKDPNGNQRTWNRKSAADGSPRYTDNPYWTLYENTSNDKRHRFFGNIGFTYNFTDNLYWVGKIYGDIYNLNTEKRVAVGSKEQSSYETANYTNSDFNYETRLHYTPKLGKDFTLTGFVGLARREGRYQWVKGKTNGGLVLPNFYNLENSVEKPSSTNYRNWRRTNSIFGMVSFGYKGMVFVEATGRKDYFSTVSQPVFYPSVTGSFVFTSAWKSKPSWFSYGKIRAAWAQAGNDTAPYQLVTYPTIGLPFNGNPNYLHSITQNNPDLVPEIKETKEAGLELRFFNDRLSANVSVYDILSKNLIIPLPVDGANGYIYKMVNSGEMSNKGIEVSLSATPVKMGKFSWNVSWNFAKNNNKLLKLYPGTTRYKITNDSSGLVSLYAIEGEAYGQLFGRDFLYDKKGNRLVDANGKYLTSEPKALGSIIPDYTMGLKNSVKYGPVTLSFLFDFQKGGKYFANAYMLGMYTGTLRETTIQGMREELAGGPDGQKGITVPGVFAPGTPKAGQPNDKRISPKTYGSLFYRGVDSQNIFDATYFKLRSVTLSYDVPLAEKKHIKGLNISLFGNNLWTTGLDWDGMDPEIAASNKGIGETSLPSTRSFGMSIGLKL